MLKSNKKDLKLNNKDLQQEHFDGSWLYSPDGMITKAIYRPVPKKMIKAYQQKQVEKHQHNVEKSNT